jgi:hypothetical protein
MKRFWTSISLIALAGFVLTGADKKGAPLHPEMTVAPDAGSYDKPMGTLGEKPTDPWSATTIGAGVDKKPQPGKPITVTGEILDLSCYLQLGKHGEKHKACGTKCIQNNQPIGLLTKDGTVYILMEEEHDPRRDGQASIRQAAVDHFAHIMEVNGTEADHAGFKAIYVQGYVKK